MKKQWMAVAIVVISVSLGVSVGAAAQGPAGAGAGAPTASGAKDNPHSGHSLNPIKWIKKSPKSEANASDARTERDKKLTAVLFAQGLMAEKEDVNGVCAAFKQQSECVAALHASHNTGLDFTCVKADVTGVPAGEASCKATANGKKSSLQDSIHALRPDADAKAEVKKAEKQAQADLKEAGA